VFVLTELGNHLKEARIAKGMSLEDLQTATKIQKRYLVGIEEGNYSMMPGKFYVRAFIKQYAEAVGIDPEELFEQYKDDIPVTAASDDIPEKLSRVQTRKNISGSSSKLADLLPKILIGVFVVGVIALLYYFIVMANNGKDEGEPADSGNTQGVEYGQSDDLAKEEPKEEEGKEEGDGAAEEEEPAEEEKPEPPAQEIAVVESAGNDTVYEVKNADKFVLKVVSTGETWVSIKNGKGYSFFEGMLLKGSAGSQTIDLSKEPEAVLVVGNTSQTELYINDQKLEYAIPSSQSVKQDITIRYTKPTE
jgi:cytoskeletal protein RodZ